MVEHHLILQANNNIGNPSTFTYNLPCDCHHFFRPIPVAELRHRKEKNMVMTFSNRIGGTHNLSHQGYAALVVGLFVLAWLVSI